MNLFNSPNWSQVTSKNLQDIFDLKNKIPPSNLITPLTDD